MKKITAYVFCTLLLLLYVDGSFPQLQMRLFGEIILFTVVLKWLLLVVLLFAILIHITLSAPEQGFPQTLTPWSFIVWAVFLIYLGFNGISMEIPILYYLFSLNAYYYYILILPMALFIRLKAQNVVVILISIIIPLMVFGTFQYLYNDPLVFTGNPDSYLQIANWNYYGQVRAFALFDYSGSFGYFLAILACLCIYYLMYEHRLTRALFTVFFISIIWMIYATLSRAAYIAAGMSMLTAVLLLLHNSMRIRSKTIRILPVAYGLVASSVAFLGSIISNASSSLLSSDSLLMRHKEWSSILSRWLGDGVIHALFGLGLIQNDRFEISRGLIIDNVYLAIGVHVGLIGLVLWLFLMWSLWSRLFSLYSREQSNPVLFAAVAFWSTWMATGVFAITTTVYPILAMLALPTVRLQRKGYIKIDSLKNDHALPRQSTLNLDGAKP